MNFLIGNQLTVNVKVNSVNFYRSFILKVASLAARLVFMALSDGVLPLRRTFEFGLVLTLK